MLKATTAESSDTLSTPNGDIIVHDIHVDQVWKDRHTFAAVGENRYVVVLQVVGDNIQVVESDALGHRLSYALPKTLPAPQIIRGFDRVKMPSTFSEEILS